MRRSYSLLLAAALLTLVAACADSPTQPDALRTGASPSLVAQPPITVMSRNLYLGADIDALLAPDANLAEALGNAIGQLNRTDYVARAQYIAAEIATRNPDAVGLQEVTRYVFFSPAGTQELDFVDVLQNYLQAMGAQYDVAVRQNDLSLPLPLNADFSAGVIYTDGDAILVRHDVARSDAVAAHYTNQQTLSLPGFGSFPNLRGWNAVTLTVDGKSVRFVNTHLEIQAFRPVQEQQARELVALFQDETLPVVMVGDFNSAANGWAPERAKTESYHILRSAGYSDLELRESGSEAMATCCHAADLSDEVASFQERLDLVLARTGATGFGGQSSIEVVVGNPFADPASGFNLWPSDHAGVFAKLWMAPGEIAQQ